MVETDGQDESEQLKLLAWRKKRQERKQKKAREDEMTDSFEAVDAEEDDDENSFVPLSKRKRVEDELVKGNRRRFRQKRSGNEADDENLGEDEKEARAIDQAQEDNVESLLESAAALQETLTEEQRAEKQRKEEEDRIMKEASKVQTNALQAASEVRFALLEIIQLFSALFCLKTDNALFYF